MSYSKQSYRTIIETAIELNYGFVDFLTLNLDSPVKQIILRHDIDYSLPQALEIAKIDAGYKIKSTFALLISSPLYNPFTSSNIGIINKIRQLGHSIALHHRVALVQTAEQTSQSISREMQVMKIFFPYIQPVFVWHNPPSNNLLSDIEVLGMVNAYGNTFVANMHYVSDSVLRNKPEDILAALNNPRLVHLLLHPIVWMSEKNNIVSMFASALSDIINECDNEYSTNPVWKRKFPKGIPEEILNKLEAQLND